MKGMRVQSIIRELRGEKIDIIEFSDDPVYYATKALSPAKISRVTIVSPQDKHMEVVVDDLQLSLAIGKRGQNVRLAAKLIGWKIDIKSEEEKRRELESRMADMVISGAPVSVLIDHGLDESIVEKLVASGIGTVERLGSMTPEELESIPDIDESIVGQIQTAVVSFYGQYDSESGDAGDSQAGEAEAVGGEVETGGEVEASGEVEPVGEDTIPEELEGGEEGVPFETIETGALERDLAVHAPAPIEETAHGEVIDLGLVEGLSGAPSTLEHLTKTLESGENDESDTMSRIE
jgi:N utilization substance protein A